MLDFNLIEDNLDSCKRYGDYYIIGQKGRKKEMTVKKRYWDSGDNTKQQILIYNLQNQTIAWKNVKKSSKGYFINLNGRCYLDEFKVN